MKIKIAIIGAGLAGLACALECERRGVIPDVFEQNNFIGWGWPSTACWLRSFEQHLGGDVISFFKKEHGINLVPQSEWKTLIMKTPQKEVKITGRLGYLMSRGAMRDNSLEKQILRHLNGTSVQINKFMDFFELKKNYDYVVVATAKDKEARQLGVWEDMGHIWIAGAIAAGSFEPDFTTMYWDTECTGQGYARVSPLSNSNLIIGLYFMGRTDERLEILFERFIRKFGLADLELVYKLTLPRLSFGRVRQLRIDNVLLAGNAAGLVERLTGCGGTAAVISGINAAAAIIEGKDYDSMMMPVKKHIENLSALRKGIESLDNDGYTRLISLLASPGIKDIVYNPFFNAADIAGTIAKKIY